MKKTSIEVSKETHGKLRREALDFELTLKKLVEFKLNKPLTRVELTKLRKNLL